MTLFGSTDHQNRSVLEKSVESFSYAGLMLAYSSCFMHQSIPSAPCRPPPGNCGAIALLVSPGGGALTNLARPGGRAFANPGDNPEKFVDVLKGMFS